MSMTEPTNEIKQAATVPTNGDIPMEMTRRVETTYPNHTDLLETTYEQKDSLSITKGAAGKIAWEMKFYVGSHADMLAAIGRAREIAGQIEAAFSA